MKPNNNQYYKGHKYRIYPTEEQILMIEKFFDLYRFVYNWGIAKEQEIYEKYLNGESESQFYFKFDLIRMYIKFREDKEWLKELPSGTSYNALDEVIDSYQFFFKKLCGLPMFKKKNKSKKSIKVRRETFHVYNNSIRFDGMGRYHNSRIQLNFDTGITPDIICYDPTISKDNLGRYFVSFLTIEEKVSLEIPKSGPIGIDIGIRTTLTTSRPINGTHYHNQPNEKIGRLEQRRRHLDKQIGRDVDRRLKLSSSTKTKYEDIPKSKRQIKRENKRNKILKKIYNIKDTYYHTITKQIVETNPSAVVMETVGTKRLIQSSHYVAKAMIQTSFYDIRRKMEDKCNKYNIPFILADNNYPSTKRCSCCGNINYPKRSKTYKCNYCGNIMDRDLNAAYNLEYLAYDYLGMNYLVA